jgi:Uma2 family endonuclease
VIIEMAASRPINTIIAGRIIHYLNAFVLPRDLGYITVPDGGFKLAHGRVRQPDVAFISKTRLPMGIPSEFEMGPDLAIEVVSPDEDVLKKAKEYFAAGTQMVWAVYADEQTVDALRPIEPRWRTFTISDTLDGGEVLPGLTLAVSDIFPT